MPLPSGLLMAFSVCRYEPASGAADGSCFSTACRYLSSVEVMHARSHPALPAADAVSGIAASASGSAASANRAVMRFIEPPRLFQKFIRCVNALTDERASARYGRSRQQQGVRHALD